uniref:ATP synthase complex subunit 8 n=1 Tax=Carterocephalus silvicola TaxID=218722 RepID=A0A075E636_9NEOP|nr:ATP synthase F0 subunit 8 [Carterocephalus silvicola]AIC09077.1 ATP synthase F0 subunit 8 [Carterocephalus silvicola]
MPQMMPINWIISFLFFILIFILFNILNYYIFNINKMNNKNKIFLKKNYPLNWKW